MIPRGTCGTDGYSRGGVAHALRDTRRRARDSVSRVAIEPFVIGEDRVDFNWRARVVEGPLRGT